MNAFFNLYDGAFTLEDHDPASEAFHPTNRTPGFPWHDPFSVHDSDNKLTVTCKALAKSLITSVSKILRTQAHLEMIQTCLITFVAQRSPRLYERREPDGMSGFMTRVIGSDCIEK